MIRNQPFLEAGEELYLHIMKINPARTTKTTVAQQLAEQATDKTVRTWDQIVPTHYHEHAKVFSEEAAHQFPVSCEWDHAIDLKPDAPNTMDCKVYPLSPTEDIALQKFIAENLEKGYIHQSKSPYCHDSTFYPVLSLSLILYPSFFVTTIFLCATPFVCLGSRA